MSLAHVLLTSLLEQPATGFELARRFDKAIGQFWQATHQQIYRELARMEAAGWIAAAPRVGSGRSRKRSYGVLPAGREELLRWAGEEAPLQALRDELMVRLRAEAIAGPLGLEREIARHMALHRDKLRAYRAIEAEDFAPGRVLSRKARVMHLILKAGIRYEESWIAWSAEALAELAALAEGGEGGVQPPRRSSR